MSELENLVTTVTALSEMYISVHVVNLQQNFIYTIKSNQYIDNLLAVQADLQGKMTNVMGNITAPESLEKILAFTDFSTLSERMKKHKVISCLFHGKLHGWCKAYFIRMDDPGAYGSFLYCVEAIDVEIGREMDNLIALKAESSRLLIMLRGLALEYDGLWYIDASDSTVHLLSRNRTSDSSFNVKEKESGNYVNFFHNYLNAFIVPEDREKVEANASLPALLEKVGEGTIHELEFTRLSFEGERIRTKCRITRVIDEKGTIFFVAGVKKV